MLRHLIQPLDFTTEEFEILFGLADDILQNPKKYSEVCKGKLLASLFFEPSTRTRLSFESAMLRLGGSIVGFSDAKVSSTAKGESLTDTLRTVENYADIAAMRHPKEGAALLASKHMTTMPIINAGDGGHQHPTQTLTDLMTIRHYKNRFDNLTIGLCGDLMFGRTIHSLVRAMNRYENVKFIFISPNELKMPKQFLDEIDPENYIETTSLSDVIGDLDILYMSRVQKERFVSEEEYVRLKDFFILDNEKMRHAKDDMIVLHPLPRVNEISTEVDNDKRAVYFEQARYGMFVRMALIMFLLNLEV
ncbi:aspartate carbamoyltransferase [Anaerosphaera aminiphila DSM 21120]|uniref:Aspartate carbamoyltransferase n=1 Tax=Anaerosphaera aminiphila DSM 21120 TaxID=1120995 RepID=A0A1M5U7E3_9FIRM|nr:aspartate carbamoyltransferase [Anaerosphaera aminiphila]SHH58907.1 aspartate carbamoyltransferase [Anaerosphaera aminiphila DSM 21120]